MNMERETTIHVLRNREEQSYGIDADTVFSGDGKDKAYDEQR